MRKTAICFILHQNGGPYGPPESLYRIDFAGNKTQFCKCCLKLAEDVLRRTNGSVRPGRDNYQIAFAHFVPAKDLSVCRPHNSLAAVALYGVADFRRGGKAEAVKIFLFRILFFQFTRLQIMKHVDADCLTEKAFPLAVRLDKQMVFPDGKFLHGTGYQ